MICLEHVLKESEHKYMYLSILLEIKSLGNV